MKNSNLITTNDLTLIDEEPRIKDIVLGERLGLERPHKIRDIINSNMAELLDYGCAPLVRANEKIGCLNRPMEAYYLNEPQALLLCMFSRTERAAQVRKELINVYMAFRHRQVPQIDIKQLATAVATELQTLKLPTPHKISYFPECLQGFAKDQVLRMDVVTPFSDIYQIFNIWCLSHDKATPSANRL